MYLEGDKWKNWHTRCSDVAIKENKDEEDTKLSTIFITTATTPFTIGVLVSCKE